MGLLDAIRRVGRAAPAPTPRLELERRKVLLVYFFPALGDAVLLAPVVRALLQAGARPPRGTPPQGERGPNVATRGSAGEDPRAPR